MENKSKKRKPPPDIDIQDPKLANILSTNTIINTFNSNDGVLKIKNRQETIYVFYYSIPEQLSLPKDSQLSLKHYLIVKPYLDDKHQDKFLIDFPIDTCSIKRYTYQTMGYCAFHSILNIFLRSEGCYHLLQRLRIFDVNAEFLSYLLNGKKTFCWLNDLNFSPTKNIKKLKVYLQNYSRKIQIILLQKKSSIK